MTRIYSLIVLILLLTASAAYPFDRAELHSRQVPPIDRSIGIPKAPVGNFGQAAAGTDWLISQSVSPSTFDQDNLAIIPLKSGNYLAAWEDNRLGASKIFWQEVDSTGQTVGSNQLVASSSSGDDLVDPRLGVDTLGRVYLFYRDRTSGLVFGSRYTENLAVDQSAYLVNDTSSSAYGGLFDLANYPDGRLAVVWENYDGAGSTIAMRLYDKDGNSVFGPATVNSDGGSSSHWAPSVAVDPNGNYLVAWEDYRNARADIYIRPFNGGGTAIGSDLAMVPPNANLADQFAPQVAYSPTDKFAIGWVDQRTGQEIYMQRYSAASGLIGGNVQLSGPDMQVVNWDLNLTVSPSGRLLATWASFGVENDIEQLHFDSAFAPSGSPQVLNLSTTGQRWKPSACFRANGACATGWTDLSGTTGEDVHLMLYSPAGTAITAQELKLNDDVAGAVSSDPVVTETDDWYNIVVYADQRNDEGDIFCRSISNTGVTSSHDVRVNQDSGRNLQSDPAVASSIGNDRALVAWVDSRDVSGIPGQHIFGRFCDHWGNFTENEFIISDSSQTAIKSDVGAALDLSKRGLVAWTDMRSGEPQVYGRWLNSDGTTDGPEFAVSNSATDSANTDVKVAVDGSGRFYVIWLDYGLAEPTAKVRRMSYGGSGSLTFDWQSGTTDVHIGALSAGIDPSGNISLLWVSSESTPKLYLTVLGSTGTVLRTPFVLTDTDAALPTNPAVAVGEHGYLSATWVDRRLGKRAVYYQILDNSYQLIDVNQPVSSGSPEVMKTPATSVQYGRAWFAWADSRSDGFNIYANNLVYLPTDANGGENNLPESFSLGQNYPNPFNPTTEISFTLPARARVSLVLYNMLGQQVRTLVDETLPAGSHSVNWDGKDYSGKSVASGIYLYRLEAGDKAQTKKMELLK